MAAYLELLPAVLVATKTRATLRAQNKKWPELKNILAVKK